MNQTILDMLPEMTMLSDSIFDHPELGFKEYYASGLLINWLKTHHYIVTTPVGGLDTAFRAEFQQGEGGPVIGLLCEYDALPMGHACGHHMQAPIMFMVAEALRHGGIHAPFRLVIYGTPAEEGPQGKRIMLENGCFHELDVALMTHAAPNTTVDIKSLSGSSFHVTFKGVATHESLAPEHGRSALDAMVLAFQGLAFLRTHVKEDVKFYTSVQECIGTADNKDPTIARTKVSVRSYDAESIPELENRLKHVLEGAALMTETQVTIEKTLSIVGKLPSLSLNEIIMRHAEAIDAPQRLDFRTRTGSTDFGYVSQIVPSAVSRFAFVPEGSPSHSQIFLDYGKSKRAHEGMQVSAEILYRTARELIEQETSLSKVQEEFCTRQAQKNVATSQ
ncbi:MAG: amidohydrolase [Christensenellales bacterium]|jgi:aminobenzoyl-glutamate utilization protein B